MASLFTRSVRTWLVLAVLIPAFLVTGAGTAGAAPSNLPAVPPGLDMSGLPPEVRQGIQRGDVVIAPMTLEAAAPTAEGSGDGASTKSAVQGNCGWVYFWIRNNSPGTLNLYWGFYNLCFPATAYQWSYGVSGPNFWRSDSGGGSLWFRREVSKSWTGGRGGLGWYDGCATLWAQNGPSSASGTACDSFWVSQ